MPKALFTDEIRQAALSFSAATGKGADNIAPRAVARLSDELLTYLGQLLALALRIGQWPSLCRLVLVVLLPKPDGGRRPIGLLPCLARIWGRAHTCAIRRWEAAHALPALYGSSGMGAQRAA